MVISTVGELRQLIAELSDDTPVRDMDDELPIIFIAEFLDIPVNSPPKTLVIECS